jgi:hypothetical protein
MTAEDFARREEALLDELESLRSALLRAHEAEERTDHAEAELSKIRLELEIARADVARLEGLVDRRDRELVELRQALEVQR